MPALLGGLGVLTSLSPSAFLKLIALLFVL
jgi:hypothetical protein